MTIRRRGSALFALAIFYILLTGCIAAEDGDGDEFSNNLISDLAPLLTLFGERFAQQYQSYSTSWLDNVVFAMAPLGVITAIVGAIRVGGPSWLRSLIGRATETRAAAEVELMSSTSHEVCELWNGDSIVRVMGSPKVKELLYFEGKFAAGAFAGTKFADKEEDTFHVFTTSEAKELGLLTEKVSDNWILRKLKRQNARETFRDEESKRSFDDSRSTASRLKAGEEKTRPVDAPNIMLNLAVRVTTKELSFAAALGVVVQLGVLIVSALLYYHPKWKYEKAGITIQKYSYPLNAIGTIFLVFGMYAVSAVIEGSTVENRLVPTAKCADAKLYIIWLQQASVINDQSFSSTALITSNPVRVVRSSRRKRYSSSGTHSDSKLRLTTITVVGTALSIIGFSLQFMGLRGLHWSSSLAQLIGIAIMTIVKAFLRRGISKRPAAHPLTKRHELDWLATALAKHEPGNDFAKRHSGIDTKDAALSYRGTFEVATLQYKLPSVDEFSPGLEPSKARVLSTCSKTGSSMDVLSVPHRPSPFGFSRNSARSAIQQEKKMDIPVQRVIRARQRLQELSRWTSPAKDAALALASAIEAVMNTFFPVGHDDNMDPFSWPIDIFCSSGGFGTGHDDQLQPMQLYDLSVSRGPNGWSMNSLTLEAIISLCVHSVHANSYTRSINARPSGKEASLDSNSQQDDWLRRSPAKQSVRFLGRDTITLRRDLQWWIPGGPPALLQVCNIKGVFSREENLCHDIDEQTHVVERERIIGHDIPDLDLSSRDRSGPPAAVSFKWNPYVRQDLGTATGDDKDDDLDGHGGSQKPAGHGTNAGCEEHDESHSLAMFTSKPLEFLYAEHIFSIFMIEVVNYRPIPPFRLKGKSSAPQTKASHPSEWWSFQLQNTTLERLASALVSSGLVETLEEAYICLVPPLSRAQRLPAHPAVDLILQKVDHHESKRDWETSTELYLELLKLCKKFDTSSELDTSNDIFSVRALAAVIAYMERIDKIKEYTPVHDEDTRVKLERQLQHLKRSSAENAKHVKLLLQKLYERQGRLDHYQAHGYLDIQKTAYVDTNTAARDLDTIGHGWVHDCLRDHLPLGYIDNIVALEDYSKEQDIIGWSLWHYYAYDGFRFLFEGQERIEILEFRANLKELLSRGVDPNFKDISGRTPLHYAALKSSSDEDHKISLAEAFKVLLDTRKTSIDIDARAKDGATALHYAVMDPKFVRILLENRAQIDAQDNEGRTPLHHAALRGSSDTIRLLLEEHRRRHLNPEALDVNRFTALHLSAIHGNNDAMEVLLKHSDMERPDGHKRSAFFLAVANDQHEIAEYLLKKGAQKLNRDDLGCTALHMAAKRKNLEMVKMLLKYGITPGEIDRSGDTALHYAVQEDSTEIVNTLLDHGAEANAQNEQGVTPFLAAVKKTNIDLVSCFRDNANADADAAAIDEETGYTALHYAARAGLDNVKLIDILLQNQSVDLQAQVTGESRFRPLHVACKYGNFLAAKRLLEIQEVRAQIDEISSRGSPLGLAARSSNRELVDLLVAHGASLDLIHKAESVIGASTSNTHRSTDTSLHIAARGGHELLVALLLRTPTSLNNKNAEGQTALHLGAERRLQGVVVQLINAGASPDEVDSNGNTALHLACQPSESTRDGSSVIETLLAAGASATKMNKQGETPLFLAIIEGQTEEAATLLGKHVPIDAADGDQKTVLHHAARSGYDKIVDLLMSIEETTDRSARAQINASIINRQDENGDTALNFACEGSYMRKKATERIVTKLLQSGADPNIPNSEGKNALHYISDSAHSPSTMEAMLAEIRDIDARTTLGYTALHIASWWDGGKDKVKALLDHHPAPDINSKTGDDNTALHLACDSRDEGTATLLLDRGIDPKVKNRQGKTALHMAAAFPNQRLIQELLKRGCSVKDRNGAGRSPLAVAVANGNMRHGKLLLENLKKETKGTGEAGSFLNSALIAAILGQNASFVTMFLQERAVIRVNWQDPHGWTPALCVKEIAPYGDLSRKTRNRILQMSARESDPRRPIRTPSAWNPNLLHYGMELSEDKTSAYFSSGVDQEEKLCVVADHPFSPRSAEDEGRPRYFEIEVLSVDIYNKGVVGIGLHAPYNEGEVTRYMMPGWQSGTWGYHGDGNLFGELGEDKTGHVEKYTVGDTVGCGIDRKGNLYFTKNGKFKAIGFRGIFGQLFPMCGMARGAKIKANFADFKYEFDVVTEDM